MKAEQFAEAAATAPSEVLTPIPGRHIDHEPKPKPRKVADLEQDRAWMGIAWGMFMRFRTARAPLMAAGTAYYGFIAMFSLLAFAYGMAALLNADAIANWLTDALKDALPGLIGDKGIDPSTLERIGRTTSVVGLLLLAVSGSAVMAGASDSLHQVYGAPPDGRNPVARRMHLFGWLMVMGPLVVISYSMTTAVAGFGSDILDDLGISGGFVRVLMVSVGAILTFALDVGITALLLSRLGGIAPGRRALLPGALLGAVIITALKALMAVIVSWSVGRPQYGSFAVPVTVLVVLWLQAMALYAAAALTASTACSLANRDGGD